MLQSRFLCVCVGGGVACNGLNKMAQVPEGHKGWLVHTTQGLCVNDLGRSAGSQSQEKL